MKSSTAIKIGLISAFLIFSNSILKAQSFFTIDGSQVITNFSFKDSSEVKDKNYSGNYSGSYSLGYQYFLQPEIFLRGNLGMRKAGATLFYEGANYRWDFQYATLSLGGGYLYGEGRFKPYAGISGYFGYLLKANQRINNEDFDIKELDEIESYDIGIKGSLGTQLSLSDLITAYAEFTYLRGLKNIETSTSGQKSNNTAYMISLGLAFSITDLK